MYWCWSGNRPIGGKMLKTLFLFFVMCVSAQAFACWKVEGSVAIDGETFKIHQKVDHDKEYIMPVGTFIFKMKVSQGKDTKNKKHTLTYSIEEKKNTTLTLVTRGTEMIKEETTEEIYSKGEEGQPHSIITIKLNNI